MKLILLHSKQGWHATNDASIMCSNVSVGCGVVGGSGDVGGSSGGVGGGIAARGPQGIWMQYFPLERLNSPHGGIDSDSGRGSGGGGDGEGEVKDVG